MLKFLLPILVTVFIISCTPKNEISITIATNNSSDETLVIKNLSTGELVLRVPVNNNIENFELNISEPLYASIEASNSKKTYLSFFTLDHDKSIIIDTSSIHTTSLADSILNYLPSSTNEVIRSNQNLIFGGGDVKVVMSAFDSLIRSRQNMIDRISSKLSKPEYDFLTYQNTARVYSFLFYMGRNIKNYSARNEFFDFIENINNDNINTKTLPQNLLYKYEIEYLRSNDSIRNIEDYIGFISKNTPSEDLSDYLKIVYLKELMESPSYWAKHRQLFNSENMKTVLASETNNKYYYLLNTTLDAYSSSRNGEPAYDFQAITLDSSIVKLSDYKGKLVLIDVWATWCGPCLSHRPDFIKLAKKYKDNNSIQVMMLSVDKQLNKWRTYVEKSNPQSFGSEVNITDGLNKVMRDKYFVTGIPTYILIDSEGYIIDVNLPEPSIKMEEIIEMALANM